MARWISAQRRGSGAIHRVRFGLGRMWRRIDVNLGLVVLIFVSLGYAGPAEAAVLHVPGDFPTIQGCIDAAIPGDECVVAPGTYNELINFHGKAITLRSSDGPEVTIIDAGPVPDPGTGKPVVRCDTGEGPDTVIEGFTLTGGTGTSCTANQDPCGGGMFNSNSSPTVTNCVFSGNATGSRGGGMYNINSNPNVFDCTFRDNSARDGGGMYNNVNAPTVVRCTFEGNSASFEGGGMYNFGASPTVSDCTFSGNSAVLGGGVFSFTGSPTVTDCAFTQNTADVFGGGMENSISSPTVSGCVFSGNTAGQSGGGMRNTDGRPTITHCTFSGNAAPEGGGMENGAISSDAVVTDCIFLGNSAQTGGGMFNNSNDPTVARCAFEGNSAGQNGGGMYNLGASPSVRDCTFSENFAIIGGGMSNNANASPTVTHCRFIGNAAGGGHGGGMYNRNDSDPVVTNCTFGGNSAAFDGGGMLNERNSSPTVHCCTFQGNVAVGAGGGMISVDEFGFNSNTVLSNSVVWGNAPDQIVGASGAVMTVSHSNVQGGWPGVGNIDADPLFADADGPDGIHGTADDDLRLLFGSPCINTGDNAALPADVGDLDDDGDTLEAIPFDLDGHARVLCTVVDMGAYESGIGDDDCDGIVGLGDFGAYFDCITGPVSGLLPGCEPFDFDGDGDVDLTDLGGFQRAFTGLP